MEDLKLCIIIYNERSSYANCCHVALVVAQGKLRYWLYHATEDATIKGGGLKFERSFRTRSPMTTNRPHHVIPFKEDIAKANFDKLDQALRNTPVPRPRPEGWTCQNWLRQALKNLEKEGLTKDVEPLVSLFGAKCPYYAPN